MQAKKQDNGVGTIYANPAKNGKQAYLNVTIDLDALGQSSGKVSLIAFKNTYKTQDKHPDFRIMKKSPVGTGKSGTFKRSTPAKAAPVAADTDDSGLPF